MISHPSSWLVCKLCVQGLFARQHLPSAQRNQRPRRHREPLSRGAPINKGGGGEAARRTSDLNITVKVNRCHLDSSAIRFSECIGFDFFFMNVVQIVSHHFVFKIIFFCGDSCTVGTRRPLLALVGGFFGAS